MQECEYSPLFVDLDGTYTKTDLLFESFVAAIKRNPLIAFYCVFWLFKGKANIKQRLSEYADINVSTLPLNKEFNSFLQDEKNKGRKIYLATASNAKYAKEIVRNNHLFDDYISSNEKVNLKGRNKLDKIKELSPKFSYAGNDAIDFEIFQHADESVLVNPSYKARIKARRSPIDKTFDHKKSGIKEWIKQLRIHQWLKNLLIFVPLVVSGEFKNLDSIAAARNKTASNKRPSLFSST